MNTFTIFEKRHHVFEYKDTNIPDIVVDKLLWKAWKITPSKNNFMPYTVSVLGPDKQEEKNKIYEKVTGNHLKSDTKGLAKDTKANPKMDGEYKFTENLAYHHVRQNSHLIVFSSRVCPEPNFYYKRKVKEEGHYAEQCEVNEVLGIAPTTSFEVGLFASALTGLCVEKGIDVSYCACFPQSHKEWKNTPYLWYDKENQFAKVHCIMSMGFGKFYRHQWLKNSGALPTDDIKPEKDVVVNWV